MAARLRRLIVIGGPAMFCLFALWAAEARAQATSPAAPPKPEAELYGFAQGDFGFDFGQNDPDWFDVNRPTRLPSFPDEFGRDGRTYFSVRQSRFGVKGSVPTAAGTLDTAFEFDMFGVGDDAGQTTIRLRLAYGSLGAFGAGQMPSPFMDGDVFPNTIEYWGPSGMVFFRNVLAYWQPIRGARRLTVAIERPGASGEGGRYADRIALEDVHLRFPLPDVSGEYRMSWGWGYVEGAAIVRSIHVDDLLDDGIHLDDRLTGWGVSVSSNVKPDPSDVLRLQIVYGHGIQNYFNDAPVDVAPELDLTHLGVPLRGKALPVLGATAFLDHAWSDRWSTAVGYSLVDIGNSNGQTADAFRRGQYALANLLHTPVPNVMVGAELQWARRNNFFDGFAVDDLRIQVSCRFGFSHRFASGP